MVEVSKIRKALDNSCQYLVDNQFRDGSWSIQGKKIKYMLYHHPLIVTSEALQSLVFNIKPEYVANVKKALRYAFSSKLDEKDDMDLHAWRLSALKYSNSDIYIKEQKNSLNYILSLQSENGSWQKFPETNILTNYAISEAIESFPMSSRVFSNLKTWILASKSADKDGWGFRPNDTTASASFTSESILAFVNCSGDVMLDELQSAKEYLIKTQKDDGSWESPLSPGIGSPHLTGISTLALMLTSEDPFNEQIEKAIAYLLNSQTEEGFFSRPPVHHIYYTNQVLSFYLYLKDRLGSKEIKELQQYIKAPQYLTNYIFKAFKKENFNKLNRALLSATLRSKVLGTTDRAVNRRILIMDILNSLGSKTVAEIIDELKKHDGYSNLKKKSHLTQIKSDLEFLKDLKLVQEENRLFYSNFTVI